MALTIYKKNAAFKTMKMNVLPEKLSKKNRRLEQNPVNKSEAGTKIVSTNKKVRMIKK